MSNADYALQPRPISRFSSEAGGTGDPRAPYDTATAELWNTLADGKTDPDAFCKAWLALHCRMMSGGAAGMVFLKTEGTYAVVASWPEKPLEASGLARIGRRALSEGKSVFSWERNAGGGANPQAGGLYLAQPFGIESNGAVLGVVAICAIAPPGAGMPDSRLLVEQLQWGSGWLESYFLRRKSLDADAANARVSLGIGLVSLASEHTELPASAMALANELATRFSSDRVSLGLEKKKGSVRLLAISNSASFQRKSQIADAIETAMEETLDQRSPVTYPAVAPDNRQTNLAHRHLAELTAGPVSLASVPLTGRGGQTIGVLTLERHREARFTAGDLVQIEAVAALIGPIVHFQADAHRLLQGRAIAWVRKTIHAFFGTRRPSLHLLAAASALALIVLGVAPGEYRVTAKSHIEGLIQRALVAPFDGFVQTAPQRAGDVVTEGEVLATLDDKDLLLERARWSSEHEQLVQKQWTALSQNDRAQVVVLGAQIEQAAAQLALAEENLARTRLTAPFDGIVVSGDLSQLLGSPVEKGKVLFEIAPLDAYRVVLQVDERDLRGVEVGQSGALALAGQPTEQLPFRVTKIVPVSEQEDGRNLFRVEAELDDPAKTNLRPGMEGVAKILAGRRSLIWIWTHDMMDRLRLALWKWLP